MPWQTSKTQCAETQTQHHSNILSRGHHSKGAKTTRNTRNAIKKNPLRTTYQRFIKAKEHSQNTIVKHTTKHHRNSLL